MGLFKFIRTFSNLTSRSINFCTFGAGGLKKCNITKRYFSFDPIAKNSGKEDVPLFVSNRGKQLLVMCGMCNTQSIIMLYMGWDLIWRELPKNSAASSKLVWWINDFLEKYSAALGIACIVIGISFFLALNFYVMQSIKRLTLLKGNRNLMIEMHQVPGIKRKSLIVPVREVSAEITRTRAKSVIPLKIKGHRFYYLIDKKGEFKDEQLFDYYAGMQRYI